MEVVGAGALEKTFMLPKSVWVDSVEAGPRSLDLGGFERGIRWLGDVTRVRIG